MTIKNQINKDVHDLYSDKRNFYEKIEDFLFDADPNYISNRYERGNFQSYDSNPDHFTKKGQYFDKKTYRKMRYDYYKHGF